MKKLLYVDKSIVVLCAVNFILLLLICFWELNFLIYGRLGGNINIEILVYRTIILSNIVVHLFLIILAFWFNMRQYNKNKHNLSKKYSNWRIVVNAAVTSMPFLLSLFLYASLV